MRNALPPSRARSYRSWQRAVSRADRRPQLAEQLERLVPLEQISGVLADRVDRAVRRAINDPPGYLTRVLGPCPTDGTSVAGWIDAATLIEAYRLEHDITDKRNALGRQPRDPTELCSMAASELGTRGAPCPTPTDRA